MWRTNLLIANCLFCLTSAQAQRELLGKLVIGDDQTQIPVRNASVTLDEDGSHYVTDDAGFFRLFLSDLLKPGVQVTITVSMPGYAIYQPTGGRLNVPADLIHRVEIQLLLKGSPKFLSDAQLREFVERTANESSRTTAQAGIKQPPDLSRYIKDWAVEYGFSVEQVQAEVSRWASGVESRKSSSYDLGLAAFAQKNFGLARDRAMEAAAEEEDRLSSLQKQQQESVYRIIRDYRLAGDAAYNALDFAGASNAYRHALAHFPDDDHGPMWAEFQLQLGNAEASLISRSEGTAISMHGETARTAYAAALSVNNRADRPTHWAVIEIDLGNVLHESAVRSEGAQASIYLQEAIDAFQKVILAFSREGQPQIWAIAQDGLGFALCDLAEHSEKAKASEYLQKAVDALNNALQLRTRERLPQDWAATKTNLGSAYYRQSRLGGGVEALYYLHLARDAYNDALQVKTREQMPEDWALTENDLGVVFYALASISDGNESCSYLQQAADAYTETLQVRTREQLPQDWAIAQNNLGAAFHGLARCSEGDKGSENLHKAIDAYENALQVRTRETLPQGWAKTESNLGNVLSELAGLSKGPSTSQHLQDAISAYSSALQVFTETAFPTQWMEETWALAMAYEANAEWANAYRCYQQLLSHDPTRKDFQAKVAELSGKT